MRSNNNLPTRLTTSPTAGADPLPVAHPAHDGADDGGDPFDEASLRIWAGLARDAVMLDCRFETSPPMRMPTDAWALHVVALDIPADGHIELFAGYWLSGQAPAERVDGYLVLRLHRPAAHPGATSTDKLTMVDVELLLAHQGQWLPVGMWPGLGGQWPRIVVPTVAAIRRLRGTSDGPTNTAATSSGGAAQAGSRPRRRIPSLKYLVDAGVLDAGDELEWLRPRLGVRHTARVRADGCVEVADGSVYDSPSRAIRALGSPDSSGWLLWRRVSDGRTLLDLRAEFVDRQAVERHDKAARKATAPSRVRP